MLPVLGLLAAYVLGSLPTAYVAGRALKGIDLREHGSGNLGATNVMRLMGPRIAVIVLLVDAAKGAIPVFFFPALFGVHAAGGTSAMLLWQIGFGVAAIAGHIRPIFLLWRGGGKGVATAAGVFLGLVTMPMLVALTVFIGVVAVTRWVSAGSLAAAASLPPVIAIGRGADNPVFWASIVVAAFVFWTHRANIGRIRRGTESRIGERKAAS